MVAANVEQLLVLELGPDTGALTQQFVQEAGRKAQEACEDSSSRTICKTSRWPGILGQYLRLTSGKLVSPAKISLTSGVAETASAVAKNLSPANR